MDQAGDPARQPARARTGPRAALALVVLVLLASAATLAAGVDWREPAWRGWLEARLSQAAGRPVELAGPVLLRVSTRPMLVLEDVRIGAAAGDADRDEARIGRVELEAGLLRSVLARWPHIERIVVQDLRWAGGPDAGVLADVGIERAEGRAPAGGATELRASGTLGGMPVRAEVRGGPLPGLLDAEASWPVELFAEAAGASLRIAGALQRAARETQALAGQFEFGLGAPDAQASARALDMELPSIGPGALAGRLRVEPGRIELRELVGAAGASRFEGELDIVPGTERPRVEGRVTAAVLDMRPFLGQPAGPDPERGKEDSGAGAEPQTLVEWYRGLDDAPLPLAGLRLADARIALAVDRWIGMPAELGAASADVSLAEGRLDAPLRARIAGVDLAGELHAALDATGALRADLALGTAETPLGGLARWLLGLDDLRGALGGFSMRLVSSGATMREIVDSTELRLVAARGGLSYGHGAGERPVSFELGSFTMAGGAGEPLRVEANGSLLGAPVELSLVTDPPHTIVRSGTSSVSLDAYSRSLRLALEGRIAVGAVGARRDAAALDLRFEAGDVRELAPWLGTTIVEPMRLELAARLRGTRERWRVEPISATLGDHRLQGMVARRGPDDADGAGMEVRVEMPRVDIDQLARLFERASADEPLALEIPVLPARVDLADLDLDLRIGEISRSALSIRDLRFTTRIRDGFMSASPLSLVALGVPLAGALEVDLRTDVPALNWWLAGNDVDAGELLRRLGFGGRIDARFDGLSLHLAARGSRLGELLDASAMTAEVEGGHLRVRDPGTGGVAGFVLATGSLVAGPGEPLRAAIAGRAGDDAPVAVSVQAARLRDLVDPQRRIPVSVRSALGGASISLAGDVERPLGVGLRMGIEIEGDRVAGWSGLTGIELPRWGPYALAGDIVIDGSGYRIEDARLSVGGSSASGTLRLDTTRAPPLLDAHFHAPVVALEDFDDSEWSPFGTDDDAPGDSAVTGSLAGVGEQAARASDDLQRLLDADTLARLDAMIAVDVETLRGGDVRLGDASLRLSVSGGRLHVDPIAATLGEGRLRLALDYAPLASGAVDTAIELSLDRVDYGLLAHRIDPGTDIAGTIDARLEVRSLAPSLSQAMRHGDGSLRFRVLPRRMRADVFDLWAGNLFVALVERLDADGGSSVNCAIGEFGLVDGVLEARRMLIDTTRVRVLGAGSVDFNDASLALRFDPWPKRAQFFSLATPIEVTGSFDDFAIGPRAGDVFMTGLRLVSSVLWVPVMKLFGARSPADGSDVCGDIPSATQAAEGSTDDDREADARDAQGASTVTPWPLAPVPLLDDPLFYGGP